MSIPNLTHYDLDGICSSIVLNSILKDKGGVTPIPVGYNRLNKVATTFIMKNKFGIVTDLNFTGELLDLILRYGFKCLYIDHHKTFFNTEDFKGVNVYVNEKYCATANILTYFKNKGKQIDSSFKKLAYYANDYDMWILKEKQSQILNHIFWKMGFNTFYDMFRNGYDEKLCRSFENDFDTELKNAENYLKSCKQQEIKYESWKCLYITASKYIDKVTILFPDYDYYFIVTDVHKMSIRTTTGYSLEYAFKEISTFDGIESAGCHEFAGGVNLKENLTENICQDIFIKIMETVFEYVIVF